jgi:cytosine/adenosine deaminase-related metal-dependent hydrolase
MTDFIKAEAAWIDNNHLRHNAIICVENGIVTDILAEHQVEFDSGKPAPTEVKLLLPGFINLHAHLEYSFCKGKLPRGRVSFTEWIDAIGVLKRSVSADEVITAAQGAVRELVASGCTTVVDCAHRPEIAHVLAESPLRYAILWELIALTDSQAEALWEDVVGKRLLLDKPARCLGFGLNPHAPYSVGSRLRALLREFLSSNPQVLVGWHVSETAEEMEFFTSGTGTFREFCTSHQIPAAFDEVPGCTPLEFLHREHLLEHADLIYHFNHFTRSDLDLLKSSGLPTIVHCPTTHDYFQRPPFDLVTLVRAGINVALGTDSLATADSLSMLEALRLAAKSYPALTGPQLLDLVTRNPARSPALRDVNPPLGVIARGSAADFVALDTSCSLERDLREILCHPSTKVTATFVAGKQAF